MVAFDKDGKIQKFETARAILDAYMPVRRDLYVKRKANLEREVRVFLSDRFDCLAPRGIDKFNMLAGIRG